MILFYAYRINIGSKNKYEDCERAGPEMSQMAIAGPEEDEPEMETT